MARGQMVLDKDLGWKQIRRSLVEQLGSTEIDVEAFIPGDPTEPGTIAHYAAINEFGSDKIPERSFIRSTMTARSAAYTAAMDGAIRRAITTGLDRGDALRMIEASLQKLGIIVVGDIQNTISSGIDPANAPSTIAQKGSSKPLIDTGALRQAITSRVSQRQRGKLRAARKGR